MNSLSSYDQIILSNGRGFKNILLLSGIIYQIRESVVKAFFYLVKILFKMSFLPILFLLQLQAVDSYVLRPEKTSLTFHQHPIF